nr:MULTISPECIES: hypothetical protein [Kribbella]
MASDQVEVGVVVEERDAVAFGDGGDQEVGDRGRSVLRRRGQEPLDLRRAAEVGVFGRQPLEA